MTPSPLHQKLEEIFDARIQTLTTPHRYYRVAAHRFLTYLQTDFPQVLHLSQLRRDPHLLGWLRCLYEEDPPLSYSTRRIYLVGLRRLLHDLAGEDYSLQPGLILSEDFPPPPQSQRKIRRPNDQHLPLPHPIFGEIFDAHIQTLTTTLRPHTISTYRGAARRFLSCLQTDFPQVLGLSELRRDPHLLGWFRCLGEQDPPLSHLNRQKCLLKLRRLLRDLASAGHPLQPGLFLPEDFPLRPRLQQELRSTNDRRSRLSQLIFGEIFEVHVQTLATTLRPSTTVGYRSVACHFLSYLQTNFPQVLELSDLRRDPHLFCWFRRLCEQNPPLSNGTRRYYLFNLRRLLYDLASAGHPLQPGLILPQDFPPQPQYLPRALSPEEDRQLQQELCRTNDLLSNALLLTRATGIRIGECVHLALDCLRSLGQNQWALHVPLGKLYTERLVPVDEHVRQIVTRILTLRAETPASHLAKSASFLLPRFNALYAKLRHALHGAAGRANCSRPVTCHQLRHSYATEMIRLGVSLPALMRLLGHKDIRMTMRYVQVIQADLQREFHVARQNAAQHHQLPDLPASSRLLSSSDLPGIRRALAATRHLLEMYRRQLQDEKACRKLQRLDKRLLNVAFELDRFATPKK
jgi:site-specific recombinase XerD